VVGQDQHPGPQQWKELHRQRLLRRGVATTLPRGDQRPGAALSQGHNPDLGEPAPQPGAGLIAGTRPTEAGPVCRGVLHIQGRAVHAKHPPSPSETARCIRRRHRLRDGLNNNRNGTGPSRARARDSASSEGNTTVTLSRPRERLSELAHHPPATHVARLNASNPDLLRWSTSTGTSAPTKAPARSPRPTCPG